MSKFGFWGRMLEMLTGAYNRRDVKNAEKERPPETNIGRLFRLIADGYELIFENAELVKLWDDIDYAEGAVLDRYGANFGVARGAASDALYRIFIRVKMIAQLSGGDDATILKAAGELLGVDYSDIVMVDVFPAKKAFYVDQALLSEERLELIEQIAYAIKRTLIAGVGLRLYLRTYRAFRLPVDVRHGGFAASRVYGRPVGWDRTATEPLVVARGAFIERTLYGIPPDTETAFTGRQSAAGGAIYHTHIKPRRID